MKVLFPVIFLMASGGLTASQILRNASLKQKGLLQLALSWPLGCGMYSLVLFFLYLIHPVSAWPLSLITVLGIDICLILAWAHRAAKNPFRFDILKSKIRNFISSHRDLPETIQQTAVFVFFLSLLMLAVKTFCLAALRDITGGWDARFFWTLKAKFYFRNPDAWRGMFSPLLPWSNPDYPLMLPGVVAGGWFWMGHESLVWPPLVALGFYVSCALLVAWYIGQSVHAKAGWLAGGFFLTIFPYMFWGAMQYADVPVAFFIAGSGFMLVTAFRTGEKRALVMAGLLAGLAGWTKNEGLFFLAWASLAIIISGLSKNRDFKKPWEIFKNLPIFLAGASVPLLATTILKIFLGTIGDYLGSGRNIGDYFRLIFGYWDRTLTILRAFREQLLAVWSWNFLWWMLAFAAVVLPFRIGKNRLPARWVLLFLVLGINWGYTAALLASPRDLVWQLQTALIRLMLHSGILALAFSFETLTFPPQKK